MTANIDITDEQRRTVLELLRSHLSDTEVWAYGSRVRWNARPSSDLDLVAFATPEQRRQVSNLREAFEESSLPFRVDLFVWNETPEHFRPNIVKEHAVLQQKATRGPRTQNEWRKVALGDVCAKIGSGATPRGGKEVYLQDGPYSLIRSQNVYNDGFHRDGLAFIGERHAAELRNVEVFEGDVLLNITGDSVARVCQVAPDVLPARVNQHVAIIRPDSVNLDAGYLRYYLASPDTQTLLLSWAGSGGTRNALTKAMIEALDIPIPPRPEQRSIAHILGTLDDKIELNRQMNETLEGMARALFQSWFVDFEPVRAKMEGRWRRGESLPGMPAECYDLFPDRLVASELGGMPAGWEVKELGEVVEFAYGKALRAADRNGGSVPVYGSNGQIGWHDKRLVAGPGIIVGRKGNPGVVTWTHDDFFPIDTTFYVVQRDGIQILPFLLYALARQNLPSVAADSAVPGLNRNLAYMNRQLIPDKHVLAEFNDYASAIFSRQHQLEEERHALVSQRDALLPRLVSGQILRNE